MMYIKRLLLVWVTCHYDTNTITRSSHSYRMIPTPKIESIKTQKTNRSPMTRLLSTIISSTEPFVYLPAYSTWLNPSCPLSNNKLQNSKQLDFLLNRCLFASFGLLFVCFVLFFYYFYAIILHFRCY